MASLPIGSDELIVLETNKLSLTIKGKQGSPVLGSISYTDQSSSVAVRCADDFNIGIIGTDTEQDDKEKSSVEQQVYLSAPIFFEYSKYELIIEALANDVYISFWHDNQNLRNKITPTGRSKKLLSGILDFGSDLGYSDLEVRINGKTYLTLTVEVYPSKIDYKKDYEALLADVTEEIYNLAFDFLKKTYMSYKADVHKKSSPVEYFAILEQIFHDYLKAVDLIMARPHHILETTHKVLPSHKLKRSDNKTVKWLSQHQQYVDNELNVDKALSVKKKVTFDTKENRLTKYILQTTIKKLEQFKKLYLRLDRQEDEVFSAKLDGMRKQLKWRCNNTFLANVEPLAAGTGMSLVFSMAAGYRDLYKYHLLLMRGLSLTTDIFSISLKDLAQLYEYWCFIKLNSILKKKYVPVHQDIVKWNGNGLFVTLVKGENASRVKYKTQDGQEEITLSYNEAYQKNGEMGKTATVSQKPDNVFKLEKNNGSKNKYEYVFDAKYRLDNSKEYVDTYGTAGPKDGDINTMHRYRDAIVYTDNGEKYERRMFGAYVLFPYRDEEGFKNNTFYKSIAKVNVGAFPFLPSATSTLEKFLDELIEEKPEQAMERATMPLGAEKAIQQQTEQKIEKRIARFWLQSEITQWIVSGITEAEKISYGDWAVELKEGMVFVYYKNGIMGTYATVYLKQKGVLEKELDRVMS